MQEKMVNREHMQLLPPRIHDIGSFESIEKKISNIEKRFNFFRNVKQIRFWSQIALLLIIIGSSSVCVFTIFLLKQYVPFITDTLLLGLISVAFSAWYGGLQAGWLSALSIIVSVGYLQYLEKAPALAHPSFFLPLLLFFITATFVSFIIQKTKFTKELTQMKVNEKYLTDLILYQREAYAKAKEQIRARDEFLSIASHELRTRLTSMLLKLQLALRNIKTVSLANFSIEHLMNMLVSAEQQNLRLSQMTSDLLNVSLITTGKVDLVMETVDLYKIITDVTERFSEKMLQANCQLVLDLQENITGYWDKVRLEQMLSNLLSNAIKFGKGKPIHIRLESSGNEARITITDNGIGISKDQQKRIFSLFERGGNAKDFHGLGVGLYIANQIVLAHKGSIHVKSTPGSGASFVVNLPIKPLI